MNAGIGDRQPRIQQQFHLLDQLPATSGSHNMLPRGRSVAPAIGLFFLSPLIGEFLRGNISIEAIALLLALAPLYGGGALLIREVTRRGRKGWPTIVLLGVAYGVVEEGLTNQALFNPPYDGVHLLDRPYVPPLGTRAAVIVASISAHAIWSICVPIAIVESLVPWRAGAPWLGKRGLAATGLIFVVGVALVAYGNHPQNHVAASPSRLVVTAIAIAALAGAALIAGRGALPSVPGAVPSPWLIGGLSLAASSFLFAIVFELLEVSAWAGVASWCALVAASVAVVVRWSRRDGWGAAHRLALAGGALLTDIWVGFMQEPVLGSAGTIHLIGQGICAAAALALLAVGARRLRADGDTC